METIRIFLRWAFGGMGRTTATGIATGFFIVVVGMTPGQYFAFVWHHPWQWLFDWEGRALLIVAGLLIIGWSLHLRRKPAEGMARAKSVGREVHPKITSAHEGLPIIPLRVAVDEAYQQALWAACGNTTGRRVRVPWRKVVEWGNEVFRQFPVYGELAGADGCAILIPEAERATLFVFEDCVAIGKFEGGRSCPIYNNPTIAESTLLEFVRTKREEAEADYRKRSAYPSLIYNEGTIGQMSVEDSKLHGLGLLNNPGTVGSIKLKNVDVGPVPTDSGDRIQDKDK